MPSRLSAHIALLLVALFYSINFFISKQLFLDVSPFAVLILRTSVGAIIFWGIAHVVKKEKIRKEDWPRIILCAVFGVGVNLTFFLWGLSKTYEVNASVVMTTTPVFVFLIAWILKEETINKMKIVGLILSFSGAVLLSLTGGGFKVTAETIAGDMMVAINASSYAAYLVLVRPLTQKYHVFTIVKWVFLLGSIIVLPIGLSAFLSTPFMELSFNNYAQIAYVVIFITVAAFALNAWAMKRVPSSLVGIYVYLQPVLVAIMTPLLTSRTTSLEQVLYIGIVLVGVSLVSIKTGGKQLHHE